MLASDRVMLRGEFTLPDGELVVVERTMAQLQVEGGDDFERMLREGPPDWLTNPNRSWPHPQDPITFTGDVRPGFEAAARALAEGGQ